MRRVALRCVAGAMPRVAVAAHASRAIVAPTFARRSIAFASTPSLLAAAGGEQLRKIVRRELEEELSRDDKEACPEVPAGWALAHKPGESAFTLKKSFAGESLEVVGRVRSDNAHATEGEAASAPGDIFPFTLVVSKGGKALEFALEYTDGELVLDNIAHFAAAAVAVDRSVAGDHLRADKYQGPVLPELNEELTAGFIAYLAARGITDDFAHFVAQFAYWKEQQEYEAWLGAVADFVE